MCVNMELIGTLLDSFRVSFPFLSVSGAVTDTAAESNGRGCECNVDRTAWLRFGFLADIVHFEVFFLHYN